MYSKRTLGIRVFLVAVGLVGILGVMLYDRVFALRSGQEVLLRVSQSDPRDALDGSSFSGAGRLNLDLNIARLNQRRVDYNADFERGQRIYVVLRKNEQGFHEAVRASSTRPTVRDGEQVIRGRVVARPARSTRERVREPVIVVKYGVEQHRLPEANADMLRDLRRNAPLAVVAKVGRDGYPVFSRLVSGERTIFQEPFYY